MGLNVVACIATSIASSQQTPYNKSYSHPQIIPAVDWVVADETIQIQTTRFTDRIPVYEAAHGGMVVALTLVNQAGLLVGKVRGEPEGVVRSERTRLSKDFAES